MKKHSILLRDGDLSFLQERYPVSGASIIIRRLVSNLVDRMRRTVQDADLADLLTTLEKESDS